MNKASKLYGIPVTTLHEHCQVHVVQEDQQF